MMAVTYLTYRSAVDLGRIPLNDASKDRYPDDVLLAFANQGVLQILKRRPDLFSGQLARLPDWPGGERLLGDAFPLPAEYLQTVADYVTFRAETVDDEHVNSGRASSFARFFEGEVPL
jgi:hypothetical protein